MMIINKLLRFPAKCVMLVVSITALCATQTYAYGIDEIPDTTEMTLKMNGRQLITAAVGEKFTYDGLIYQVIDIDARKLRCTTYDGSCPENLVIPSAIDDFTVTEIGNSAFNGCNALKTAVLPSTLTRIGEDAFKYTTNLTSVNLPEGLIKLEPYAFYKSGVTEVSFPAPLKVIGHYAFYQCPNLTSVSFADGLETIEQSAFQDTKIESVILPSTLQTIETKAFANTRISALLFPASLKRVGWHAFAETDIETITIPATLESCEVAFYDTYKLTDAVIEDGMTTIFDGLFSGCRKLTTVYIPSSVTTVGSSAFAGCSSLETISLPNSITSIGSAAFMGCRLTSIDLPDSITEILYKTFSGCTNLQALEIPAGVTSIGRDAFEDMRGTVTMLPPTPPACDENGTGISLYGRILVPAASLGSYQRAAGWNNRLSSLYAIGGWVMENGMIVHADWYNDLIYVNIKDENVNGEQITAVGNEAFKDCSDITTLLLDDSISKIGDKAFQGCTGLNELTLPAYLTEIGANAFDGCSGLTAISMLTDKIVTVGEGAFDNSGDCLITVQPSMVAAYQAAYPQYASRFGAAEGDFILYKYGYDADHPSSAMVMPAESYKSLSTLSLPRNIVKNEKRYYVEAIADEAFIDCANLTAVLCADGENYLLNVEKIGARAFKGCTSLSNANAMLGSDSYGYSSMISEIGEEAFSGCTALTTVPTQGSAKIGNRAFSGCTSLGPIEFSNYCYLTFGDNVFDGCTGITQFVFNNAEPCTISDHTFDGTDCPIYVLDAAVDAYKDAWPQYASRIFGMGKAEGDIFNYSYNADGTARIVGFSSQVNTYELETLIIPATTTFAGKEYSVTEFKLSGGMEMIHDELYLYNVKSIIVNAPLKEFSATRIYLRNCENFQTLVLPSTLETLKGIEYWGEKFGLTSLNLPRSLKRIECCFNNTDWTGLTIPVNIEYICADAFRDNTTLERIEVKAKMPPTLGANAFDNTNECPIVVPFFALDDYLNADSWKPYAARIVSNLDVPNHFPMSEDNKMMTVGDRHKLRVIEWESSDPEVVTVDEDGNIHAVSEGDALITARTLDGKLQSSCFVSVDKGVVSDIEDVEMNIDNESIQAVYNMNGVQLLGEGADADDLCRLSSGIYIVRTSKRSYKIKL